MSNPAAEIDLMQRVKRLAGPYLEPFAASLPNPWRMPSALNFWAALTANESGVYLVHNTVIPPRFESGHYTHLLSVLDGVVPEWDGITLAMLAGVDDALLRNLASSWGFTQVMAWEMLPHGKAVNDLNSPDTHYQCAAILMNVDIRAFHLDPTADFEKMARCWNGGHPTAATFDPQYVPNLLSRMEIYSGLDTVVVDPDEMNH